MKITIICIGRPLPASVQTLVDDYEQRLKPYARIDWQVLKPSDKPADAARSEESTRIAAQLQSSDTVVLLDERGVLQTNEQFAQTFEKLASHQGRLVLVIGGAFGVSDDLRQKARFVWSLSTLVFPHQLVRLIVTEQLYRTYMLQQGHPYHHA